MREDGIQVRSFRSVFALERRIHRIDRWRVPTPYGIPLRGIAYFCAAFVALIVLGRLPLARELLAALPAPFRYAVIPVALAYAATSVRVDGRTAHETARSYLGYRLGPRRTAAFSAAPMAGSEVRFDAVTLAPCLRTARYRAGLLEGPATVRLRYPARARQRGRTLILRQRSKQPLPLGRGQELRLRRGQRLRLRSAAG